MFRIAPVILSALFSIMSVPASALTEEEIDLALDRLYAGGYVHDPDVSESVRGAISAYQRDWELPENGVLDDELLARLVGKHPDTLSREQWTEDGRCLFHNKLPTPRVVVSFDGDCPNGKAQGEGTQTWRFMLMGEWAESTAVGTFVDGELSGQGIYRWAGGQIYQGEFVRGARTGYGISRFPNGETFEGDFVDGKRNGRGIYRWTSGNIYEGDFVNDARTGHGIFRWASGNIYEGDFVDGARTGSGTYRWVDGAVYEGAFVDGAQTGPGALRLPDGTVLEGQWIDGVLQD